MNVFNEKDFSDRILHVEIVADSLDYKSDSVESDDDCGMDSKSNNSNKKQKRENLEEKGDAASDNNLKCCTDVKVKTLHISSAILATRSPFFYKLFQNGMRESHERVVTLRINTSEEAALMDLLNFMYSNILSATSALELVGVLIIADKFEVSSCMSYCCELLKKLPMSLESALLYLELPSSVLECVLVKPLLDAAKKYVVMRYRNVTGHTLPIYTRGKGAYISPAPGSNWADVVDVVSLIYAVNNLRSVKSQEEAMALPLSAIEIVLGSDGLRVTSEEDVYNFILLWGRARYPKKKERREILTKLLGRFIYFPCLSMSRLEQIQECPEFDSKEVSKLILKSLYLNAGFYGPCYHFPAITTRHSIKQDHNALPIQEVLFESRCVVYLNLTKEKCWSMYEPGGLYSQPFPLGGAWFTLFVEPEAAGEGKLLDDDYFGLFVEMQQEKDDGTCCMFDYELAVKKESSKEFECLHKADHCALTKGRRVGSKKLFEVPGSAYFEVFDDSEYVIDGIVRVRAEFMITDSQA